jgi:hypothetical protein
VDVALVVRGLLDLVTADLAILSPFHAIAAAIVTASATAASGLTLIFLSVRRSSAG